MPDGPAPDTHTIENVFNEIPLVVKESKAGYKTTEFWLVIATGGLTLLGTLPVPDHYKGVIAGALAGLYALSRGIAKKGVAVVEPAPEA